MYSPFGDRASESCPPWTDTLLRICPSEHPLEAKFFAQKCFRKLSFDETTVQWGSTQPNMPSHSNTGVKQTSRCCDILVLPEVNKSAKPHLHHFDFLSVTTFQNRLFCHKTKHECGPTSCCKSFALLLFQGLVAHFWLAEWLLSSEGSGCKTQKSPGYWSRFLLWSMWANNTNTIWARNRNTTTHWYNPSLNGNSRESNTVLNSLHCISWIKT